MQKDSQSEYSLKENNSLKRIVLVDPHLLMERVLTAEISADPSLQQYQIVSLNNTDQLVQFLSLGEVDILIAVDEKPEHIFAILELSLQLSPHTARIMIAKDWTEKSIRDSVNRVHAFRALNFSISPQELRMHLLTACVEADLSRSQSRLMKEASKQNRELENLTSGLEKIVEERTLHIRESKDDMEAKLDLVRQLIRFIKELSQNISFEELMDHVRKYMKKFAHLGDPILVLREEFSHVEIISYRSGAYWSSGDLDVSQQQILFSEKVIFNDKEMSRELANHFGRPFVRVLSIPLQVNLIRKFGFSKVAAMLCIESSMNETEQNFFIEQVSRILRPVSVAIDRSFLQRALARQSFRWERTFNGLRDALAIVDVEHQVLHYNSKFSERSVQRRCYESFAKRSTPCEGCPMTQALVEGKPNTQQIHVGEKIYEVSSYPIHLSDSAKTSTVVNQYVDVTQARQLYVRMLQSEKMSALGLLAGNIAHELNNPLSGIRNLAQVMIKESEDQSQLQNDLKEIEKAAARSQGIIKNLLEFSAGTPQKLQKISLAEIVERTMPLLKTTIRNHRSHLRLQAREALIAMDPQLMQQVVFNLVTNACQAMPDGGTLEVSTELVEVGGKGQRAQLTVSDTGPGIPVAIQEKIFEPFFTTKTEGQGTGLGLSLSLDIIKKMGGEIQLRSELGQGSQFIVLLPISLDSNIMKVMIIDDEALVRRSLARALFSRGHQVTEISDGIHGLESWTKELPDLVFLDVLMPGLTGPQVIQQLDEKIRARTKIILMSAYTGDSAASPKLKESAELFLLKPFEDIFKIVEIAEGLFKNGN